MDKPRQTPNILITGTPGVGKSSHCDALSKAFDLKIIDVNKVVADNVCHDGWSKEHESFMVDEDKLLDVLETMVAGGGYIIDSHMCEIFPESWIDLVVVLRCETSQLYDRLMKRNYSKAKVDENIDAEIMQTLLEEAMTTYKPEIVMELNSRDISDIDKNIVAVSDRLRIWNNR